MEDEEDPPLAVEISSTITAAERLEDDGVSVGVTVITGYLGAGKSTLVNYILNSQHGKRIAVILNEFGEEIGVERAMINEGDGGALVEEWVELANGCICCTVKHNLVQALEQLVQRKERLDHILLETTGLANPAPLASVLWLDDQLESSIKLDSIITVVDAKNLHFQLNEHKSSSSFPEAFHQIAFADTIILNKVDLVSSELGDGALEDLEYEIHNINSLAKIVHSVRCQVDLSLILNCNSYNAANTAHLEALLKESRSLSTRDLHDTGVRTLCISDHDKVDLDKVHSWLEEILWEKKGGMDVYRCKGVLSIKNSDQLHTLQAVRELYEVVPSRIDSLDQSLWFLHQYVKDAVQNHASLDEILIPMLEHTLRFKDKNWQRGGQVMVLLNWLFLDELIFQTLIKNLADIIVRKDDRYVALGWCILVRSLVEFESVPCELSLNGLRERYNDMLKVLCSCIPRLTCILSKRSILQEGFELPSRLSVCAADCVVSLTSALTTKAEVQTRQKRLNVSSSYQQVTFFSNAVDDQREKPISSSSKDSDSDMEYLLWHQLKDLVILVQRLLAWSRKSRPLHAKGLEQVLKWLHEINLHYDNFQNEAGKAKSKIPRTGALVLSSCWRHYSILLFLEDCRFSQHYEEWLNQYLSGIQYYSGNRTGESIGNKDGRETIIFFLNCICLLLGRLDSKRFESTISEYGTQICQVLLLQFHSTDEDVIDEVVSIFKAVFLNSKFSSGGNITDTWKLDVVMPLLLNLLDERDVTTRAVIILIAESCLMSRDNQFLLEVFKRFDSDSIMQRRNAIDVISEIVQMSSNTRNLLTQSAWQDTANQLIKCLEDEEILIRKQAADLLPCVDPTLFLPSLVRLVYSSNDKVLASAREALIGVLKCHNQNIGAIFMLLDCVSDFALNTTLPNTGGNSQGSKLQSDRVLSLIPQWSQSVQDWKFLIGPLIDKLFEEPSNAVLVRFLSIINDHFVKAIDVVLKRILSYGKGQKEIDECFYIKRESQEEDISLSVQQSLFERLCPLLVIRMLPLEVFNDLSMSVMYGQLPNRSIMHDMDIVDHTCVAALLLNRAFSKFEFDDVRKLAAELCGRIHPQVLYPFVSSILEDAASSHNIPRIKACLFSMCTSLVVRGQHNFSHFDMFEIAKTLEVVLSWPSQNGDEVSKSQHGCIDCMALMICAELQAPDSCSASNLETIDIDKKGHASLKGSILGYVIDQLINGTNELVSTNLDNNDNTSDNSTPLSLRLCMANVLISACQKLLDSRKRRFTQKVLPRLISFVEVTSTQVDIRAACIGVIFSAVYHLKSAILPYANDIFRVSLNALKNGPEKERIAGAKLMVSLMSSEDPILECISEGLLEARDVLSSVSSLDPSIEVQQICQKMLQCLLSP